MSSIKTKKSSYLVSSKNKLKVFPLWNGDLPKCGSIVVNGSLRIRNGNMYEIYAITPEQEEKWLDNMV